MAYLSDYHIPRVRWDIDSRVATTFPTIRSKDRGRQLSPITRTAAHYRGGLVLITTLPVIRVHKNRDRWHFEMQSLCRLQSIVAGHQQIRDHERGKGLSTEPELSVTIIIRRARPL